MLKEEITMNYEAFLELVKSRRTIRRFKSDPVPDEYVGKIIEAACWAPSGFNSQPWEFVVVKKEELRDSIIRLSKEYRERGSRMESYRESWQKTEPWYSKFSEEKDYGNAPVLILLFGDTRALQGLSMYVRFDYSMRQSIFLSSLSNAFLYMQLAATTLGLASQWISGVAYPFAHCMIKDLLGIPEHMEIFEMMALGYPAIEARPKLMRDREKMIHYDYCGQEDFRTDDEVNNFIVRTRNWVTATTIRLPD